MSLFVNTEQKYLAYLGYIVEGNIMGIQTMMQEEYDVNGYEKPVLGLLIESIKQNMDDVIDYLIAKKIRIANDPQEVECFHVAIDNNKTNCVRYFLENGYNPHRDKDEKGYPFKPIIIAIKNQNADICRLLIQYKVEIHDDTMIDACSFGSVEIVDLLKNNGGNVNALQMHYGDGWKGVVTTALHEAVRHKRLDIVKYLLENGANPEMSDEDCKNAVQRAFVLGFIEISDYIRHHPSYTLNKRPKTSST